MDYTQLRRELNDGSEEFTHIAGERMVEHMQDRIGD